MASTEITVDTDVAVVGVSVLPFIVMPVVLVPWWIGQYNIKLL